MYISTHLSNRPCTADSSWDFDLVHCLRLGRPETKVLCGAAYQRVVDWIERQALDRVCVAVSFTTIKKNAERKTMREMCACARACVRACVSVLGGETKKRRKKIKRSVSPCGGWSIFIHFKCEQFRYH